MAYTTTNFETMLLILFAIVAVIILIRSFRPDTDPRNSREVAQRGTSRWQSHTPDPVKRSGRRKKSRAMRIAIVFIVIAIFSLQAVKEYFEQAQKVQQVNGQTGEKIKPPVEESGPLHKSVDSGRKAIPAPTTQMESPLEFKPGLVNLSLTRVFHPVRQKIAAISTPGSDRLSEDRPRGIEKEPNYLTRPLYGQFAFGPGGQSVFNFAFDKVNEEHPVLYLDRNRNGDLSDDGPPLENQGNGRFATAISIPYALINPDLHELGDYSFWFFTNRGLWPKKRASHYSRLQFTTELKLGEKWFHVWLAERGYNDADFTNDGVYIDLNQDDKIDSASEHVPIGEPVYIDGNKYIFIINNQ